MDSVHSGEVPVGEVAVPSSSISTSGAPDHPGEVPAGGVAVPISSGASICIGGPAGGVPARDVPVPSVIAVSPLVFFQLVRVQLVFQFLLRWEGFPLLFSQ